MDAFTASVGVGIPVEQQATVMGYIAAQQEHFRSVVGEDTWSRFEEHDKELAKAAPRLSSDEIDRLRMQGNQTLNSRGVEELWDAFNFQTTTSFNQQLLLANPEIATMQRLGQIQGWEQEYDGTRNVLLQKRVESGLFVPDESGNLVHREYGDDAASFKEFNHLTALERRIVQYNQQRAAGHIAEDTDFSSVYSGGL